MEIRRKPRRYPYSGKLKASTTDIVKALEKAYSAYRVKGEKRQQKGKKNYE